MSLLDRINANPLPFAQLLGIEFISVEEDALSARMTIRPELCMRIPIQSGHRFRFEAGRDSDLMPATIPK